LKLARLPRLGSKATFALLDRRLKGLLLDAVERIALLDDVALLEQHLLQIARDAGAHRDALDRLDAADEFLGGIDRGCFG
jgi:hypothetical protein